MSTFQGLGLQSEGAAGLSLPVEKRIPLAFWFSLDSVSLSPSKFLREGPRRYSILAHSQALLLVYYRRVRLFDFFHSVVRSFIVSRSMLSTSSSAIAGAVATRNL